MLYYIFDSGEVNNSYTHSRESWMCARIDFENCNYCRVQKMACNSCSSTDMQYECAFGNQSLRRCYDKVRSSSANVTLEIGPSSQATLPALSVAVCTEFPCDCSSVCSLCSCVTTMTLTIHPRQFGISLHPTWSCLTTTTIKKNTLQPM